MTKTIALVGRSDLTDAFSAAHPEHEYIRLQRPQYDVTQQADCDAMLPEIEPADIVIVSPGLVTGDAWSSWLTNAVGPCYLLQRMDQTFQNKHFIVVSSGAAHWTSWPGIPDQRLVYNCAKSALSHFADALYQSGRAQNRITAFEPGKFQTRMSGHKGATIQTAVKFLDFLIAVPDDVNITTMQTGYHRNRITEKE
jgi:NAD(P)-dependent dehydrogenase (short-subunit alcohol dehydrogenase family)